MKKFFSVALILSFLTVSTFSVGINDCNSCNKKGVAVTESCHVEKKVVEIKSCCSEKTIPTDESCHLDNGTPKDCKICAHTDQPPAKIEASVTINLDKKFVSGISNSKPVFLNPITQPNTGFIDSTSSPPIVSSHLVCLDVIRLLI